MSNAVVVQPWSNYPPAMAHIRVLNTNNQEKTILFLEPLWVWGQKVYDEDDIVLMPKQWMEVSVGNGGTAKMRLATKPNLTYEKLERRKGWAGNWHRVSITPEDAKKWNKELLRSMIMDEDEYYAFLKPIMTSLAEEMEEQVDEAGSSSNWDEISEDMIMDDTRDEAEGFVRMLTPKQLIRLNHVHTGWTINDYKDSKDQDALILSETNDTVDSIMEDIWISDDAIYAARASYLEGLEDSRWDNWEPNY
jgi:hypothetical protein